MGLGRREEGVDWAGEPEAEQRTKYATFLFLVPFFPYKLMAKERARRISSDVDDVESAWSLSALKSRKAAAEKGRTVLCTFKDYCVK